ncbi:Fet3 protein [Mycena alexandri]|uniref:Fet3 protein n=1 Tax=Mycena alexandri TaxID=1745969 RepID=A0AAD6S269_9AGAR|nr:Fet3 protein [Mycena alexandri]
MWTTHLLATLLVAAQAFAGVVEVWWNLTPVNNVNPDARFPRQVFGVNGSWPPPPLDVQQDNVLIVHAKNFLPTPATLHHHGMFFNSTTWQDGALGVTECGIPINGGEATYTVAVNSSRQFGTYWVHSHAPGQYTDGLRAPLVIHATKEAYTYDEEFTVILGDWYHQTHAVLIKQYISTSNPDGIEPVPDSPLIYFAHDGAYLGPKAGSHPDIGSVVGFNENATLPFHPGKTYRLRVINTSAFAKFIFYIDGHDMRVIEVDGTDIEEFPIFPLSLAVAQRYSVLVTARHNADANFAVHADMDPSMFDTVPDTTILNATASITYNSALPVTDLGTVDAFPDVPDISMVPLKVVPAPSPDRLITLLGDFSLMTDGTNRALFNNITYNMPLVPAVLSEMTLGRNATVAGAYGPTSFVLNHLDVIDILVQNADAGAHPFHIHGHKFQIIERSSNFSSNDPSVLTHANLKNPLPRDTILIDAGGSARLRFVADNPGTWFFHCHIEWHLEAGFAVQLIEAPLIAQRFVDNIPAQIDANCKALHKPISGNAAGHASATNLAGLPLGPFPVSD